MIEECKHLIGRVVRAGSVMKRITGVIVDIFEDEDGCVFAKICEKDGTMSNWAMTEIDFTERRPMRKETLEEKYDHFERLSGFSRTSAIHFVESVWRYLDGCGYFMSDLNIHGLPEMPGHIKNIDRDFGTWLLDMALQYNMEQGLEYECRFIKDRKSGIDYKKLNNMLEDALAKETKESWEEFLNDEKGNTEIS